MAEYINKEELTNYIKRIERKLQGGSIFPVSPERIDEFPTIDIVHCYECRWLNDKGKANCFIREKTGICRTTFFCADGERRTE